MSFITKAASAFSNAFSKTSGLAGILSGLESVVAPRVKPMAKKPKAKAKAKGKDPKFLKKVKKVALAAKAMPPPPPGVVPFAAPAIPAAPGNALTDTRKCAHSRAYKKALLLAKKSGKDPANCRELACKAGAAAAAEWDKAHKDT